MMALMKWFLLVLFVQFSGHVFAEQYVLMGDKKIHYSVFPSTFLQPEIAKQYGLKRSDRNGVLSISVVSESSGQITGHSIILKAKVKNILSRIQDMKFREIRQGEAVYYIAEFLYDKKDIMWFTVDVILDKQSKTIEFDYIF